MGWHSFSMAGQVTQPKLGKQLRWAGGVAGSKIPTTPRVRYCIGCSQAETSQHTDVLLFMPLEGKEQGVRSDECPQHHRQSPVRGLHMQVTLHVRTHVILLWQPV